MALTNSTPIVSYCGLYCTNCPKYQKKKCPGCQENVKATWCKVRTCCIDNNLSSCASCKEFTDVKQCGKLNNFISKMFGLVFNSDRIGGINYIRTNGTEAFITRLENDKAMTFKKGAAK